MVNLITENIDIWTTAQMPKNGAGRGNGSNNQSLYGIKKLRELILELAVRGKLVLQDPNDEPASVLLEKIAKEKARLIKEGKIKKEKKLPEIGEDENHYKLPEGWKWVRIGEIAQHNSGKTLDGRRNSGTLREYITTSNLYWGYFLLDDLRQMPIMDDELDKCTAKQFDLLICEGGEAGRAAVWNYPYDICFQNHIHRVRLYCSIDPYYVFRVLLKMSYSGEIDKYRKGVGISNMSGKELTSITVPLPPLAEQRRIVTKVDELMAMCDYLEQQQNDGNALYQTLVETTLSTLTNAANPADFGEAWQGIAGHFDILFTTEQSIDQLKKTILQLAVMGKLVRQDPKDEPASVLQEKIAKEKARLIKEGKIKKEKPLSKISDDEKPFELPARWVWSRIGEASLYTEYGMSERTFEGIEGIPVLTMGDIQNGKVILGGQKLVSPSVVGLPNLYLKNGDLLYNRTNSAELVGKTGVFTGPDNAYTFASYLVRIRCMENCIHSVFLNLAMNTPLFRMTQIEPYLKQQCGQANVNATIMKSMIVPIPPINEQRRIMAKVDELMALCDALKARLKEAQITQIQLADAIVNKVAV